MGHYSKGQISIQWKHVLVEKKDIKFTSVGGIDLHAPASIRHNIGQTSLIFCKPCIQLTS